MTKYVIVIPDGAADEALEQFDNQTALEAAHIPHMDAISRAGRVGMVQTVPKGFAPGSDVAQMTLLGYNPRRYYSGRAAIEAAAQDIPLALSDWVFRCNLVTLADGKMADHSAGHITNGEAETLMSELAQVRTNEPLAVGDGQVRLELDMGCHSVRLLELVWPIGPTP